MEGDFLIFLAVGFLAQIVDGALGMAYGVISSSMLLAFGVPPAHASAAVHLAEVATTAASGAAHAANRNVDWRLFRRLVIPGAIGGAIGALLLTAVDADLIRPVVALYLAAMGGLILLRALRPPKPESDLARRRVAPLAAGGGFLDAVGGGGWGPIVTSTLVAGGGAPRRVIGTVSASEFVIATTISAAFLVGIATGLWQDGLTLTDKAAAVAGLVVGGVLAAPLAAFAVRIVAPRLLMVVVGVLVVALAGVQIARLLMG
jgi:uncharacterized membrane protein YfcA